MPVKYIPYYPNTVQGQAILNNITRTRRVLRYRDNDKVYERIQRGMPYYELEKIETVGAGLKPAQKNENMLIRGECISACAYLKDRNIKVDLVYIDPPFASGADYAKKVWLRKNPKIAEVIAKAEEQQKENGNSVLDLEELRAFEEKMYGDIWNKEDYLNWMYENLLAIKAVMNNDASIYVHLDWHIGHYVKVLMDEVFGEDNFLNEIVWCYYGPGSPGMRQFNRKHDVIFWYSLNSDGYLFNEKEIRIPHDEKTLENFKDGLRGSGFIAGEYEIPQGKIPEDWFIEAISGRFPSDGLNRVDYATEKPSKILERIIKASSHDDMLIADFFGGSGVTAKVAHDLKRKFIHCDVSLNSIQTTRDRLVAAGAAFDIYDIQDGVSLFRNPAQTMDKLKTLITGLKNEDSLDSFWEGGIQDSKLGLTPVYIPNLLDHSTKVLDIPMINSIINEAMPDLPDDTKKVIVFYVDIENEEELKKFIYDYNLTGIDIELRDLKSILDDCVINDEIDYLVQETMTGFEIEITSFTSDRIIQKIDAYNQKKSLTGAKKDLLEENSDETDDRAGSSPEKVNGMKKKNFTPISISKHGLELIELISLDCTNKEGIWKSDVELKIDKNGYVILNGNKTKEFWNAKITSEIKPLRMKVRNIAGDESVMIID